MQFFALIQSRAAAQMSVALLTLGGKPECVLPSPVDL